MKAMRTILVDDHKLVRAGIRMLLSNIPEVEVVAEANSGAEALRLIGDLHPDLVLMDIALPDTTGLKVTEKIKQEYPATKVIILSMHVNEEYVLQAMQIGASGYLLKDSSTVELDLAIKAIISGEAYLSPVVSRFIIDNYSRRTNSGDKGGPAESKGEKALSPRKREIIKLIATGCTTKEIAQKLNVSINTVDTHRVQIMRELDIHDIAGLVRYAIRMGIISSD